VDRDSLADLPADSRREIVAEVCAALDVEAATAENLVRSAEPLWDAMERAGGLVDSWGGDKNLAVDRRVVPHLPARLGVHSVGCGWQLTAADPGADHAEASQNPQKIPSGLVLSANSAKSMFASDRFATIGSTSGGIDRNVRPTCPFSSLKSTNNTV
jgi:hypothetical protein